MNHDQELKLQSYLDGELSVRESKQVAEWIAKDNDARLLYEELKMAKTAVLDNEPQMKLPESREFFWSKIEREIQRQEAQPVREESGLSLVGWLHRFLVPISAAAVVAVIGVVMISKSARFDTASVETLNEEMGSISFRSEADRMTVIYLYDRSTESPMELEDSSNNQ